MTDQQMAELKQFMVTTVAQSEARILQTVDAMIDAKLAAVEARLEARMAELREEMLEGFRGVGEAIQTLLDLRQADQAQYAIDRAQTNARLLRLEQRLA